MSRSSSPLRPVLLIAAVAAAALTCSTAAHAASLTLVTPGPYKPGDQIQIEGAGFDGLGGEGHPVVAIKVNDKDTFFDDGWTAGGDDVYTGDGGPGGEQFAAFVAENGSFDGWIRIPDNLPGDSYWFRVLTGSISTGTNFAPATSFKVPFDVVKVLSPGFTNGAETFFPGLRIPTGGGQTLTVQSSEFPVAATVTATIAGESAAIEPGTDTVDSEGNLDARLTLPDDIPAGLHDLAVTDGTTTWKTQLQAVPHTVDVLTPAVRPGGILAVAVDGYVGIAGGGQGVALDLDGAIVNFTTGGICPTTGATTGAAILTGTVPLAASGVQPLEVRSGYGCTPLPLGLVTDPFPRLFSVPGGIDVTPSAPAVSVPARVTVGTTLRVEAEGFPANVQIRALLDGQPFGPLLTTSATGEIDAGIPIQNFQPRRERMLVLRTHSGPSAGAATRFTTIEPPNAYIDGYDHMIPGTKFSVVVTGFARGDGAGGQQVGFALAGGSVLGCLQTDATGSGSATLTLPPATASGRHVLHVTSGTACGSGSEAPARSLDLSLTVPENISSPLDPIRPNPQATVVAAKVKALKALRGGKRLRLSLNGGSGAQTAITVRSRKKIRVRRGAKPKFVVLAKATIRGRRTTVELKLTKAGRAALKRLGKIRVIVRIAPKGGKPRTKVALVRRA